MVVANESHELVCLPSLQAPLCVFRERQNTVFAGPNTALFTFNGLIILISGRLISASGTCSELCIINFFF